MNTYPTTTTTDKKQASSYTGKLDHQGRVVIHIDDDNGTSSSYSAKEQIHTSASYTPSDIANTPSSGKPILGIHPNQYTSIVPRHGQRIAAPKVLPPVLIAHGYGKKIPTYTTEQYLTNAKFLAGNHTGIWNTLDTLWFIRLIKQSGIIGNIYQTINTPGGIIDQLLNSIDVQNPPLNSATPNPYITTTDGWKFLGDVTFNYAGSNNTNPHVIFVQGNITVAIDINGPVILIATGDIDITCTVANFTPGDTSEIKGMVLIGNNVTVKVPSGSTLSTNCAVAATNTFKIITAGTPNIVGTANIWGFSNTTESGLQYSLGATVGSVKEHAPREVVEANYWTKRGIYNQSTGDFTVDNSVADAKSIRNNQSILDESKDNEATLTELMEIFLLFICAQYGLQMNSQKTNPTNPTGAYYNINRGGNNPNNGTQEIRFLYDGIWRETIVVFEFNDPLLSGIIPNYGIHTEPFGFDDYIYPNMLQTQRVGDEIYIPLKLQQTEQGLTTNLKRYFGSGIQFGTNPNYNDWKIRLCDDSDRIDLDSAPYNDLVIVRNAYGDGNPSTALKIATIGMLAPKPSVPPAATNEGGSQPFDDNWVSEYVELTESLPQSSNDKVVLLAPYSNFFRYVPKNALVVSADGNGNEISHGYLMIKNQGRRSRISSSRVQLKQSRLTGQPIMQNVNMMGPVVGAGYESIIYGDETELHFWKRSPNGAGRIFIACAGTNGAAGTAVEGVTYAYNPATDSVTINGLGSVLTNPIALVPQINKTIDLHVYFGDIISDRPFIRKLIMEEFLIFESFEFLAKGLEGLVHYHKPTKIILGTDNEVDLKFLNTRERQAVASSGFTIGPDDKAFRYSTQNEATVIYNDDGLDFFLYGRRIFEYNPAATKAKIPVTSGSYHDSVNNASILVDSEGMVDLVPLRDTNGDLPNLLVFNIGLTTYVGEPIIPVQTEPYVVNNGSTISQLNTFISGLGGKINIIHANGIITTAVFLNGKAKIGSASLLSGVSDHSLTFRHEATTYSWTNIH
jgi:hypothetical protein